ncbi:retrotransposon protein, putative, ty1-copia subclass [Tanacetum coccineum]
MGSVKEKNKDSDNVAAKDAIVPPVVEGIVTDSPSDPNKSGLKLDTSYANLFTRESSKKSVNFPLLNRTWNPDVNLLKEDVGNVSVWVKLHGVPMMAFSEDDFSSITTKLGTPLMLDSYTSDMCMQSWGKSSYDRVMIELLADVELKDTIVVAMPKLVGEGFCTCTIPVEYEWKPPKCACCKVFGHVQDECPKNIGLDVAKNLKKPSQSPRGVSVGPNVGFKPVNQVYRPVFKKNNANTSGKKKKDAEPTKEVSTPNPFDVLNSAKNDVDLGINGGLQIWLVKRPILVDDVPSAPLTSVTVTLPGLLQGSKPGLRQDSKPKGHNLSTYKRGYDRAGQTELVKEKLVNSHDLLRPGQ